MRIAVFCSILSPWSRQAVLRLAEQGNEVHVIDFLTHGQQAGYLHERSEVFSGDIEDTLKQVAGVHLIETSLGSRLRYLVNARELRNICQKVQADVLLTLWGGGWATMSWLSGFRPYAVYVGGGDILRVGAWQRRISRRALSKANIVFANGRYFGRKAQEFSPKANVIPLYYGVDPERFVPGDSQSSPLKIVCTRGFSEVYNNGYLIEALAHLDQEMQDVEVVFTSPGQLISETMRKADSLLTPDVRKRVKFCNGVTDDEMLETLQSSHVYVSLSRSDGTSISLLEGLSCGLFPVLSDIPQNREWITPERGNGLLVPLDQPEALASALKVAISDAGCRRKAEAVNRALILDRADGRKNMRRLVEKLKECALC